MILLSYVVVIFSVNFNNQSCWQANEVCYVAGNNVLSSERFAKLALSQEHPQGAFRISWQIPHPLRMFL